MRRLTLSRTTLRQLTRTDVSRVNGGRTIVSTDPDYTGCSPTDSCPPGDGGGGGGGMSFGGPSGCLECLTK